MATRVYLFLEENDFKLEAWEGARSEFKRCVENHRITVSSGRNMNHASIEVQCGGSIDLALKFNISDLKQEKSSMLASMEQSVVVDIEDNDFDYWDQIPPFGVVELYDIELERGKKATEPEVEAFVTLIYNFLLKHFMMFAFRESEIESVRSYIFDWSSCIKTFSHDGETGYRVSKFG
ncbi:hypothetical protein SAMN05216378_1440 [Paenibacillus catalpae]|uniref:Uncharacterized protein n=1 Tax=Paenibacillus catalpae TaxID=1045775 RepID=A0A1I1V8D7_9BACL|nr:hypothetical protein [Paenibacillus catalpae]SFD79129.1 hypothetical protein SAMN05216378_1440 [Paenibacillus catalpae]